MHSMFVAYGERQRRRNAGAQAQKNARVALTRLDAWLAAEKIDPPAATVDDLERYIDHLGTVGFKHATVKLHVTQLRAAYRHAHRRGVIASDPGADLLAPKMPDVEPETFTPAELRRILAAAPTFRHDAAIRLMIFGGLRRIEVCRLTWNDVDYANETLTVDGKGHKIRKVPIHPALAETLRAWQPRCESEWIIGNIRWGAPSVDVLSRLIDTVADAAGVHIKSHIFRKTLATDLYERGVQENVIESIFGWSKSSVRARHYTRIADESMRKAILLAYADQKLLTFTRTTATHGNVTVTVTSHVA
jgi:integrase